MLIVISEIAKIRDGVGVVEEGWFAERVSRSVGNGSNTIFWLDRWLGDIPLCAWFSRLFELTTNKPSTVAEMFALSWEEGGPPWRWRRRLWVWEQEMVVECTHLLNDFDMQPECLMYLTGDNGTSTFRGAIQCVVLIKF